jgi:hypothetical protein
MTLLLANLALAATLHVDDGASGEGDGSVSSPFSDLQRAIESAEDGDDIRVAGGTYSPITVDSKEVHLFGGYDADFTAVSPDTPSAIEGTPQRPAVTLYEVGDSVLDGFTLRGGQRGLHIDADYLSTTNKPLIRNNLIEDNGEPTLIGGGVFADHCDASFIGNTVRDNVGDRGPGLATICASVLLEDNVIEDNIAYGDHGGGLYLSGTSLVLRGNLVRGNEVGVIIGYGWGAGITVYGEGVTASFERNVFTGNHAQSVGSGAFVDDGAVASFEGDLFYDNVCGSAGGAALYVDGYSTDVSSRVSMQNVTVASHDCSGTIGNAIYVEAQSTVEIHDSIFWGNAGDDFAADATSSITASYTLSEELLEGEGNLSVDPLFADPDSGDFHVRSTQGRFEPASGKFVLDEVDSPTIDAGDPASDYALEPGPNGLRVNLGHTGNTAEASMGGPGGTPPEQEEPDEEEPLEESPPEDGDPPRPSQEPQGCGCQSSGGLAGAGAILLSAWAALSRGCGRLSPCCRWGPAHPGCVTERSRAWGWRSRGGSSPWASRCPCTPPPSTGEASARRSR